MLLYTLKFAVLRQTSVDMLWSESDNSQNIASLHIKNNFQNITLADLKGGPGGPPFPFCDF